MADARDTLMLAFERGLAGLPEAADPWLFLNADMLPATEADLRAALLCIQGFRPTFLALVRSGYRVEREGDGVAVPAGGHAGAIVLLGRSRAVNEALVASAWRSVRPGGTILVAGDNDLGIKSMRKWASRWAGTGESLVKHHAGVFALQRDGREQPFHLAPPPRKGRFLVAPGMFSADGPDAGSRLLAGFFDQDIAGDVADLGAGWGWLGTELLARCPAIRSLTSVEADHASLEAARHNLSGLSDTVELRHVWMDVVQETLDGRFDTVVMNPPFHAGRAADPAIGIAFIEAALRVLKPRGRLLMVANRQLPYEASLGRLAGAWRQLADESGYKVIEATRA